MIKYQSRILLSFPNYQFHLLHYITFVEQKVMIQLGDCQAIFFLVLSLPPFHSLRVCFCRSSFLFHQLPSHHQSFSFGIRFSRLPVEIKWPCPLGKRASPVNCLWQEVTETGTCFTDFFVAVTDHPKEAERWERLCMLQLLVVHFTLLFNFRYQSVPQGEEHALTEPDGCNPGCVKMLHWQLVLMQYM